MDRLQSKAAYQKGQHSYYLYQHKEPIMPLNELEKAIQKAKSKLPVLPSDGTNQKNKEKKSTILIVDDDKNLLTSMNFIFKGQYEIIIAASGSEAIQIFKKYWKIIHVVVLDIKMNGIDGIKVMELIKQIDITMPVIFNTAYPGEYAPLSIIQSLHPFSYNIKGSDPTILHDNIHSAVQYKKLLVEEEILNKKLLHHISRLVGMSQFTKSMNLIYDKETFCNMITKRLSKLMRAQWTALLLFENGSWRISHCEPEKRDKLTDLLLETISQIPEKTFIDGDPLFWENGTPKKSWPAPFKQANIKIKNLMLIPVRDKTEFLAMIALSDLPEEVLMRDDDRYILSILAGQIGSSLNNIIMVERNLQSRELSTIGKMAATIVHDLNNPLSVIIIHNWLLKKNAPDNMQESIQEITHETERIKEMIAELADFIRNGKTKSTFISIKLHSLIREIVERMKPVLKEDHIQLELDIKDHVLIKADESKLTRVFENLINNAKHALKGSGAIRITLLKNDKSAEIRIRDNGQGIDPSDIDFLFEPFFTKKKMHGLGLGLYIVKQIIQQHNGTIIVDSIKTKETTFTISIPLE